MDVQLLHHISLPVADVERSRRFYREIMRLAEIARPDFPFPGAWFRLGDRELHLIGGEEARPQGARSTNPRELHYAVRVSSYREPSTTSTPTATARMQHPTTRPASCCARMP